MAPSSATVSGDFREGGGGDRSAAQEMRETACVPQESISRPHEEVDECKRLRELVSPRNIGPRDAEATAQEPDRHANYCLTRLAPQDIERQPTTQIRLPRVSSWRSHCGVAPARRMRLLEPQTWETTSALENGGAGASQRARQAARTERWHAIEVELHWLKRPDHGPPNDRILPRRVVKRAWILEGAWPLQLKDATPGWSANHARKLSNSFIESRIHNCQATGAQVKAMPQ